MSKLTSITFIALAGLFIEGSSLDHSCRPNATQVCVGSRMEVRATRDIDTDKDEIFVSYVDLMLPTPMRRSKLKRGYFFDCNCENCSNRGLDAMYVKFCELKVTYKKFDRQDNYEQCFKMLQDFRHMITACLGQYSAWHTEMLWLSVQFKLLILSKKGMHSIPQELHDIWNHFKSHLLVTHGSNHSFYKSAVCSDIGKMFGETTG